jgi:hypothetical protein
LPQVARRGPLLALGAQGEASLQAVSLSRPMRERDQVSTRFRIPSHADLRVFAGYCAAAVVYIAIGVVVNDFMFSVVVAMVYIVVAAWLVPTLFRRLRR